MKYSVVANAPIRFTEKERAALRRQSRSATTKKEAAARKRRFAYLKKKYGSL